MGFRLSTAEMDAVLASLSSDYTLYAPKWFEHGGAFSDTDLIRYGEISTVREVVFDQKSHRSFKEALLPITQNLFYFTEEQVKESDPPAKGGIVFLRSCDLHAVRRLDEIYLHNGVEDYYYRRVRDNLRFVLIGCKDAFDNCFCVDMGTNRSENYDMSIEPDGDGYLIDCKRAEWRELLEQRGSERLDATPAFVRQTQTAVHIPEGLTADVMKSDMWSEFDSRCINCGRCNFVCPTCTCYTMQDIFYTDNGKTGERRRVWASCMVDGFTDVAGGGCYRQNNGQRMRFKVLHKVLDYKQRFGYHMCVGCGRCDDACPEYISFSGSINKLDEAMWEVNEHAAK